MTKPEAKQAVNAYESKQATIKALLEAAKKSVEVLRNGDGEDRELTGAEIEAIETLNNAIAQAEKAEVEVKS